MRIGNREFDTQAHTYVMGILNVTPDSFADGGKWMETDAALFHAARMIEEGAHLIDIGGESTRPGYEAVSAQEEMERVIPVIERIRAEFDIPVSLDTCKGAVARAGIAAGADMINDIRGLRGDGEMAGVIAESGAACCLMHSVESVYIIKNKEVDITKQKCGNSAAEELHKVDIIYDKVTTGLKQSLFIAEQAGIAQDRIILDPGIGFSKTHEENLALLHDLGRLHTLGYPLLLGASRKSVIGRTLELPPAECLEGTLVTTALAVMNRIPFVRVHDVKENIRVIRMAQAIRDCAVCETANDCKTYDI